MATTVQKKSWRGRSLGGPLPYFKDLHLTNFVLVVCRRENTPRTCFALNYCPWCKAHPFLGYFVVDGHVVVTGDGGPNSFPPGVDFKHLSAAPCPLLWTRESVGTSEAAGARFPVPVSSGHREPILVSQMVVWVVYAHLIPNTECSSATPAVDPKHHCFAGFPVAALHVELGARVPEANVVYWRTPHPGVLVVEPLKSNCVSMEHSCIWD